MMIQMLKSAVLATGVSLAAVGAAQGAIISAVGVTINSGGPGYGSIEDTINQSGLTQTYTSGVTDFLSFTRRTLHSYVFEDNEWFSNDFVDGASVTFDLGAVTAVDAMALWNDEASGIGSLDLSVSTDGVNFSNLLSDLSPTNNPLAEDYGADIFSFAATSFQYIRMDMSGCPQSGNAGFGSCAIGEVAFNTAPVVSQMPVPAALPMLLTGLGAFGWLRRRRR